MSSLPNRILLPALFILLVASILLALAFGAADDISPARAWRILLQAMHVLPASPTDPESANYISAAEKYIVLNIRLPRILVAAFVGAGLAVSGCCLQGLYNNPLASPDILGLSSGGAAGAVAAIFVGIDIFHFGESRSLSALPIFAFAGALASGLIVYALATRRGQTPVATLLLAGIAINALLGSIVSLMLTLRLEDVSVARRIVYWLIGGLESRGWQHVQMAALPIAAGSLLALLKARDLNSLALGEETARSLGVSVQRFKIETLALVSLATGASVAVCGVLSFVGLIVPHVFRLALGPDHRRLLPACMLGGAAFLVWVDLISRVIVRPSEIQVGILTSIVGGPFFLALLLRHRRKAETL